MSLVSAKCGICGALLSPGGICPRCLLGLGFQFEAAEEAPTLQRFGPYHAIRVLGEGGMGIVYLAQQDEPVRRQVAVKLIKPGMDSAEVMARFESERQALALMNHPNIATVLDAGATESGRPYFVMEYVPGVPITRYCDENRLSSRQRLELFCQVCRAVHHAHQKGIIHRDIKPSNVLVQEMDGSPTPKVIDFGVAKATSQRLTERTQFTQLGVLLGTPAYMSPEQAGPASLDLDITTDIYSLGVLLYELLVGVLPFDPEEMKNAGYAEICRIIREDEPPRPTTTLKSRGAAAITVAQHRQTDPQALVRQVRGDLEWITMKALEKDRTRRYASASEFAADIGRHLNDEPVLAGPPGAMYRLGKAARKHKASVIAAGAVMLALLVGLGVSTRLYLRAEKQRGLAVRQSYSANIAAAAMHLEHNEIAEARRRLFLCAPLLRGWEWRYLNFQLDSSLATIFGRGDALSDTAPEARFGFADDGSRILWNSENVLNVWNRNAYQRTTYGGFGSILAFSRNGDSIVAKGFPERSNTLRVLDPASRNLIARLAGHLEEVDSAAFSPDSKRVVSASRDGVLRLWDAASGRTIASAKGPAGRIRSVAFSPDGKWIASAFAEKSVRVWDAGSLKPVVTMVGHQDGITCLMFQPGGKRIVSASRDRTLRLWDVGSGKLISVLEGHSGAVLSAAFSPDGLHILSGSEDMSVRVWDSASGKGIARLSAHSGILGKSVVSVAFSPDGTRFFAAAADLGFNEIRIWDSATWGGTMLRKTVDPSIPLAFSSGTTRIAASVSGSIQIWDSNSGEVIQSLDRQASGLTSIAFSPDGNSIATGYDDHTVAMWNVASGKRTRTLSGHTGPVNAVAFSPDGARIASASSDRTARIWDASTGRTLALANTDVPAQSVSFSPDGTRIVTHGYNRTIQLWSAASGRLSVALDLSDVLAVTATNGAPSISPDGKRIALGLSLFDDRIGIWDARTGKIFTSVKPAPDNDVMGFSPDGTLLISISMDHRVHIWDAATTESLLSLRHDEGIVWAGFTPDGTRIITVSPRGTVLVWDTRSRHHPAAIAYIIEHEKATESVAAGLSSIRSDRTLDDNVRKATAELMRAWGGETDALQDESWDVVKTPGAGLEAYRTALRKAEEAASLEPSDGAVINTLGVAQYRTGEYREAISTLTRVQEFNRWETCVNAVFVAMAHHQLGNTTEALERLRGLKIDSDLAANADLQNFRREAESLINRRK